MRLTHESWLAETVARVAASERVTTTIQDLLRTWGYRRRDFEPVDRITADLAAVGLRTEPPFTSGPIESVVQLVPITPPASVPAEVVTADFGAEFDAVPDDGPVSQAALRIRDVMSEQTIVTAHPDELIASVQTQMMSYAGGLSQLPVIDEHGVLRGVISWESLACAHARDSAPKFVRDACESWHPEVVSQDADLVDQIPKIIERGFVLVRDDHDKICRIVTTADLAQRFNELAGVFVMLREIEHRLRRRIDACFRPDELKPFANKKKIVGASDLTFGGYARLLAELSRWRRLGWKLDHTQFLDSLRSVQYIRNEVMHFHPHPLTAHQRDVVRRFNDLLRRIDPHP